jgi:hypothetical protein
MKKTNSRSLKLARETLQTLSPAQMAVPRGAYLLTPVGCTVMVTKTPSICDPSQCLNCPLIELGKQTGACTDATSSGA